MSTPTRAVLALTALGVLAAPTAAQAHPQVYTATAKVLKANPASPPTDADLVDQTRYAIVNDGYTLTLREGNGLTGHGLVNYLLMPSGSPSYRATLTPEQKLQRTTDAQPHAQCLADPAGSSVAGRLNTTDAILTWQRGSTEAGTDPFYAYVPFQKDGANLGDAPAKWIAEVKELTGVDLAAVADPKAACESLGGTYYAADPVQSSGAQVASALISAAVTSAVDPLNAQIAALNAQVADLTARLGDAQAATTSAQAAADAASARATDAAKPLTLKLGGSVSRKAIPVALTGPTGLAPKLTATVEAAQARRLGLSSRFLATGTATLADGTATATLKPSAAVARRLKRAKGSVPILVSAVAGDRTATTTTTIK